ncbi:zinc-finger protein [Scheffersomyces spartinae]|uniref:Zinc-finger protein n=1 Tax=Scheffersomyces spartinae TaxID=45513 RepID=A0A9P7V6H5_9ASCO|nr:zinc-finger protein [Scheffersomyces spartinae]KAG7192032.1 zinc-finger protein [Scheffersomyces spartinae]
MKLDDCFFDHCGDSDQFSLEVQPPSHSSPANITHIHRTSSSPSPLGSSFSEGTLDEISAGIKNDCCQGLKLDLCEQQHHQEASRTVHRDSLCQDQENKKQLFESLIKNLDFETSMELGTIPEEAISEGNMPSLKRQKLTINGANVDNNIDIHFPHICHQHTGANLHQSCFHTTIPTVGRNQDSYTNTTNTTNNTNNPATNNVDYDFVIQFNNFDRLGHNQKRLEDIPSDRTQLTPEKKYSCRWDNCSRSLSDATFMDHLLGHHIEQEYTEKPYNSFSTAEMNSIANSLNSEDISINPSTAPSKLYQCEWNNCNFADGELNGLINHVLEHKEGIDALQYNKNKDDIKLEKQDSSSANNNTWVDLTPSSTDLSPDTTASYQLQPQLQLLSSSITLLQPILVADQINITDFKLFPKENKQYCTRKPIDPTYTCKWQIGVDPTSGNPIECNQAHDSAGSLQEHLISEHIGGGKSQYNCGWVGCERHGGKSFTQRQKLLRHIYIHTGYKPCKCPICGVSFAVEVLLTQHMRIHSGEKPYECHTCGKRFATSSSLSIHNRVHSDNRPLVCPYPGCGKRFRESTNLTKHRRTHERLVSCTICHETFTKKSQLKKHMNECHKGIEPMFAAEHVLET